MIPREIEIQNYILESLSELYNISPFSVIYTECYGIVRISITLFGSDDLQEFLDFLGYRKLCDKTGFSVFYNKQTVILSGLAKDILFKKLKPSL